MQTDCVTKDWLIQTAIWGAVFWCIIDAVATFITAFVRRWVEVKKGACRSNL